VLEIVGLRKSFAGREVLRGVDLAVSGGECVALLGGNGSGKTTTLRAVVGLVIPDAGEIRVDGMDLSREPRAARRRLAFLPQKSVFPSTLSAREALEVVARLRGISAARVDEEISRCELEAVAGRPVATLSGGERQRLGLAVALLPDAGLYLFDEPTANLDPQALAIFFRRVADLRRDGRGVLFTTHVRADVETLATRALLLDGGRIADDGARFLEARLQVAAAAAGSGA
jgi:ABC-type multidrug transport system ATPase subunit